MCVCVCAYVCVGRQAGGGRDVTVLSLMSSSYSGSEMTWVAFRSKYHMACVTSRYSLLMRKRSERRSRCFAGIPFAPGPASWADWPTFEDYLKEHIIPWLNIIRLSLAPRPTLIYNACDPLLAGVFSSCCVIVCRHPGADTECSGGKCVCFRFRCVCVLCFILDFDALCSTGLYWLLERNVKIRLLILCVLPFSAVPLQSLILSLV